MREEEKDKEIIFGILYWAALILIVALFDPEMGGTILGMSIMLFVALHIIELLS